MNSYEKRFAYIKPVSFCLCVCALSACSLTNKKTDSGDPVVVENHSMLEDQQGTLAEHADRLDSLSESQEALLYTLAQLRSQMSELSDQVAKVARISADKPPKPRSNVVAKDLKLVKSADEVKVSGKATIGRVEYVWLESLKDYVKARIDTGARSSTLNAGEIQRFERNGEPWVRFEFRFEEQSKQLELPLLRQAKMKNGSEAEPERRPVVKLPVRLGEIREETEVVLLERSDAVYPLLLGRSFLQDIAVVDVAQKFTRSKDPKLTKQAKSE